MLTKIRSQGICLLVVTLALTLSAVPATGAAVTVSQEYKISTTTVRDRVSIAWNGTNYFAVWVNNDLNVVLGALITPTGGTVGKEVTVLRLPPKGSATGPTVRDPAVAWDGSIFFVVASFKDDFGGGIAGATVSKNAEKVSTPIFLGNLLQGNELQHLRPAVAGNSKTSTFYVAWQSWEFGIYSRQIVGAPVSYDNEGRPTAAPASQLTADVSAPESPANPAVASNGSNFVVAWDQIWDEAEPGSACGICLSRQIFATAISPEGVPLVFQGVKVSSGDYSVAPSLASDGNGFYLAWRDGVGTKYLKVQGARLDALGMPKDGLPVTIAAPPVDGLGPGAATWDGLNFVIIWNNGSGSILGARVSPSGTVQDPNGGFLITSAGGRPAAAAAPELRRAAIAYVKVNPVVRFITE